MATESNKSTKPGDAKYKPKTLSTAPAPKTKGVVTRGNGAATKGTKAYGPLA